MTTFFTMAYILVVNPASFATEGTGLPFRAVMTATVVLAASMTLLMGLYARLPYGVAPGMGINAFFTFGIFRALERSCDARPEVLPARRANGSCWDHARARLSRSDQARFDDGVVGRQDKRRRGGAEKPVDGIVRTLRERGAQVHDVPMVASIASFEIRRW